MQFLDSSKYLARVWLANTRASLVREMEFRSNFILGTIRQVIWFGIFIVVIDTLFANTQSLAGWSQNEVLIILALSRIIEGLMTAFFIQNLMRFTSTINTGEFDFYILRPVPTLFFTSFRHFRYDSLGNVLMGIGLFIYAIAHLPSLPTLLQTTSFILISLAGITIYYSLLVLVASLAFKLERLESLWGFNSLFSEPLTIPFDVFPSGARIALTYLLPLAFVVFVPAQALTGKVDIKWTFLAIALAALFLILANIAWQSGLKRYTSASS